MRIPTVLEDRERFYQELTNKCLVSRESRKGDYTSWRSWYLFGNGPEDPAAQFNKINSHLEQLTSFVYSAETTRFSIKLGADANKSNLSMTPVLNQRLNDEWDDSDADMIFNLALVWSFVYGSTFCKLIPVQDKILPYIVTPDNFGVLREDLPSGTKQEAFVHIYYITKSELYRRLFVHPGREKIVERLSAVQHVTSDIPEAVDRIIMSQSTPQMMGTVNLDLYGFNRMKAQISEETVEMKELYVWNDEFQDYQVVTMGDPSVVIFDRLQGGDTNSKKNSAMFLKGESPFVQVCPAPMPDYFWGASEVQKLVPLQQMRNKRMDEIIELLERQVDPPTALSGFSGIQDERNFALNRAGGLISSDIPTAKAERFAPDMPEDLFRELDQIDRMFSEASGIENVIAGRGEQGVRSAGHAAQLARLGSSRAKKRALIVEDNLEKIASLFLRIIKERDPTHFTDSEGKKFIADQFTGDFMVKVDAHSNSPIFMEDLRQLAFSLFKAQAIDKEMLVRLLQPPMEQEIIERIKKLPQQQQMAPQEHKKGGGGGGLQAIEGGKSG